MFSECVQAQAVEIRGRQGVQIRHFFTLNSTDIIKKRAAKIDKSLRDINAFNKNEYSNNSYRGYKNDNKAKKHAGEDFSEKKNIGKQSPLSADNAVGETNDEYSILMEEAKDSNGTWVTHEVSTFQSFHIFVSITLAFICS